MAKQHTTKAERKALADRMKDPADPLKLVIVRDMWLKNKALLEMLENAIRKNQNNLLSTAEIIQELIEIAREVRTADQRGAKLGLSEEELAFYDALGENQSAIDTVLKRAELLADRFVGSNG